MVTVVVQKRRPSGRKVPGRPSLRRPRTVIVDPQAGHGLTMWLTVLDCWVTDVEASRRVYADSRW
jgi:hypothetical protein